MPDHSLSLDAVESDGCFMYTVSGFGVYRCGGLRRILGPGQVLAYRSPNRGRLCLDKKGLPWRTLGIHVRGELALSMFDIISNKFGMFHELPQQCAAVKLARKLVRYAVEQPLRSPHFWSHHTFLWLDAWWQSAQKSCTHPTAILNESAHSSRLVGLAARSVKTLAEQLGYSRSHLSRKLKWQWDMPPGAVLRNVRMEEVERLLRVTNMTITDIAAKVGFSEGSALTRSFKKAHGIGPLAYREAQRRAS